MTESLRPGEFELIDRYFRPLAGRAGLGLNDDVALLVPVSGTELVVTVDSIVEGLDYFPDDPPEWVAARALRVNLSDLAAKGADPLGYLLALNLPDHWTEEWVARFAAGLAREHGRFGLDLFGGDTGRSPERTVISVTAFGRVPTGKMVHRDGASPGEVVFVTGTIGDSALGLRIRRGQLVVDEADSSFLRRRFSIPEPRVELATVLRRYATAALDVSDGLVADLGHLCRASGVDAEIGVADVPLSEAATRVLAGDPRLVETILTGGEDYEVLFTAPAIDAAAVMAAAEAAGVRCTPIGRIVEGEGRAVVADTDGTAMSFAAPGHDHFR